MTDESSERDGLILGVDGGGTSTIAWLASADGAVLGRGKAGASNARAVGDALARLALEEAIASAFADARMERAPVSVACLGLAGFDRPEERARLSGWARESRWAARVVAANDGDLVVAAGTPLGWGVGVIAGTGSIAVGRAVDDRKARSGGWGPLIGDEGSAYVVVLDALRLVARRADGREGNAARPDPLSVRLCDALGVESPALIPSRLYAPEMTRAKIAAMASQVLAANDPDVIERILLPAGWALAELARAVARALDFEHQGLPIALAGSFLLGADAVRQALLDSLRESGYSVNATLVPEPVRGALALAQRALREARSPISGP